MRIVIDLQGGQTASRHRGIGRYSLALADAMLRQPRGHEFWIVTNADIEPPDLGTLAELLPPERIVAFRTVQPAHWRDGSNTWRRYASERAREAFLRALKPHVVHVSSLVEGSQDRAVTSIAARDSASTAATLYDLIPLHDPSYLAADWLARWYADKMASLRRAGLLLAISDYVRADAIETLSIPADRVVNISSAAADSFRPVVMGAALRARLQQTHRIAGDYLLYSGAMDPRKNLERLLAAYAMLPDTVRARCQLVISGRLGAMERERLMLVARRLSLPADRLVLVGQVSDQSLVELYSGAALFVLPSLQEGFGLPALEAMACGAPVIGSSLSSVPEVIGRRDALFDPTDTKAMARAIERVLSTPAFAQELRDHGLRRAREFSWSSSASRAIDAFEQFAKPATARTGWRDAITRQDAAQSDLVASLADAGRACGPVSDQDLLDAAVVLSANDEVIREIERRAEPLPTPLTWRVEGPFDSSYSLALVNREIARALSGLGVRVALHSMDGAGDTVPDARALETEPALARLHHESTLIAPRDTDVSSRLLFPPRVVDMESRFNMLHAYAWEESELPAPWVDHFNEFLQGVSSLSSHVHKLLIDNGVGLPGSVCGAGVDHWDRIPDNGEFALEARSFRFLHVSSCLPRKGVDVLLSAYGHAFTDADDVSLVIKTFPNPQQDVRRQLQRLRSTHPRFPHVIVIEQDLSSVQLKCLYAQCHVMVAPSRAEGFGLPLAEAMVSGMAVVTTGWGGQLDFCTEDTAWLIDYRFEAADTIFELSNSVWAEPSSDHLADLLQTLHQMSPASRGQRIACGQRLLRQNFTWARVAERLLAFAYETSERPIAVALRELVWIGSVGTARSGAAFAAALVEAAPCRVVVFAEAGETGLPDEAAIRMRWDRADENLSTTLFEALAQSPEAFVLIHVQRDSMPAVQLEHLLTQLQAACRHVVMLLDDPDMLTTWPTSLLHRLKGCDRILVPGIDGLNLLRGKGIVDTAAIFPSAADATLTRAARAAAALRMWNMLRALSWRPARHATPRARCDFAQQRDDGFDSSNLARAISPANRSFQ